jgi:hypothetical protein
LKRRFRTPADALRALGLDEGLLEEIMAKKPRLTYDEIVKMPDGSYLPRQLVGYGALDAAPRRRARDDETQGDPDDLDDDEIEELLAQLAGVAEDWRRKRASDRRRTARDDPPPFSGRPETGGTMTGGRDDNLVPSAGSGAWRDRGGSGEAEDRGRRRYAHDSGGVIIDRDFLERFPEAARIRMS